MDFFVHASTEISTFLKLARFYKSGRPDSRIATVAQIWTPDSGISANPDAEIPEFQKFGSLDSRIPEANIWESQ